MTAGEQRSCHSQGPRKLEKEWTRDMEKFPVLSTECALKNVCSISMTECGIENKVRTLLECVQFHGGRGENRE